MFVANVLDCEVFRSACMIKAGEDFCNRGMEDREKDQKTNALNPAGDSGCCSFLKQFGLKFSC
ncbi:MAG: hypothetical protein D3906_16465 [Candidatus Electrothrix sp. AUS1_2]|nr:hypothetical protein [Candidatus Electrothrix sp. AUS1_2]